MLNYQRVLQYFTQLLQSVTHWKLCGKESMLDMDFPDLSRPVGVAPSEGTWSDQRCLRYFSITSRQLGIWALDWVWSQVSLFACETVRLHQKVQHAVSAEYTRKFYLTAQSSHSIFMVWNFADICKKNSHLNLQKSACVSVWEVMPSMNLKDCKNLGSHTQSMPIILQPVFPKINGLGRARVRTCSGNLITNFSQPPSGVGSAPA